MGTDIHGVFQRHNDNAWVDVPSGYDESRHYQLFAVLAGVRNGFGFAGVRTGEPVTPIAEPRGLPADFEMVDDCHPIQSLDLMAPWRREYHREHDPLEVWMGYHSHSWLSSEEMLSWYAASPTVVQEGVLRRDEYNRWDKVSPPQSYCGAVMGATVVTIDEAEVAHTTKQWTHVRCTWESPLRDELAYFFDEVRRLHELHGGVRFVFGFDS